MLRRMDEDGTRRTDYRMDTSIRLKIGVSGDGLVAGLTSVIHEWKRIAVSKAVCLLPADVVLVAVVASG